MAMAMTMAVASAISPQDLRLDHHVSGEERLQWMIDDTRSMADGRCMNNITIARL